MARRKQQEEFPDDIKAMSFDQLKKAYEDTNLPENQAEFDRLVTERDAAQDRLHAHVNRGRQLLTAYTQQLSQKIAEKES